MRTLPAGNASSFKALLFGLVVALSVGLAACETPAVTQTEVADLADLGQLVDSFNEVDSDNPRLILLLSPT